MPGYTLKYQEPFVMETGNNKTTKTISQTWIKDGSSNNDIYINYGGFVSITEAYIGSVYLKNSMVSPFNYSSPRGYVIGDKSWFPHENPASSIITQKNNFIIHILKGPASSIDYGELENALGGILAKIDTLSGPNTIRHDNGLLNKQIERIEFENVIHDIDVLLLKDFSEYSFSNSEWMIDSKSYIFGRKKEWIKENGGVFGIDIAKFETPELATQAMNYRIHEEFFYKNIQPISPYNINTPSSIDSLIQRWNTSIIRPLPISAISQKGLYAIHVYHYNQAGNDLLVFPKIVKEVSKKINF